MSRLNELIVQHCPGGVKYLEIGAVVERARGIRWDDVQGEELQYIDLSSVDRTTHAIVETSTVTRESAPSRAQQLVRRGDVLFGTTRPMLKRYTMISPEFDGQVASTAFCVLRPKVDVILTNYLFHLLGTASFYAFVEANERGSAYPAIPDSVVKKFKIPVPPLDVQRAVASALDELESLKVELAAKLEMERDLRRSQFAHYREEFFDFSGVAGVPMVAIGDLGTIFRGKRFTKNDYVTTGGVGVIHYGEIYTEYGTKADAVVSRVGQDLAPSLRYAHKGDVVLTDVGETVEDVGKAVAWMGDEDVAIHDHCYVIRSDVNATYLSYLMQTAAFARAKERHIARTKVKTLLLDGLKRIQVPIPSEAEQLRVVKVLQAFEEVTDVVLGELPVEIEMRQKQYEYYHDRLLTFEEAVA